ASAAAPAALVASTVQAVTPGGAVPARVAALTQGVLQAMFWTKVKVVLGITLLAATLGTSGILLVPGLVPMSQAQPPVKVDAPPDPLVLPAAGQPGPQETTPGWQLRATLKTPAAVKALAVSPDGKILAGCGDSDGTIQLWDLRTQAEIASLPGKNYP